jgi:hypothetical protein
MPYGTCVEIARRFLHDGKPFSGVDPSDLAILKKAMFIRNAIAHRSSPALARFRKDVDGVNLLPPHKQFPGAFLRRVYRAYPTATWNDLYFDTLQKVGVQLATSW